MHRARLIADEVVRAFIERELDEVRNHFYSDAERCFHGDDEYAAPTVERCVKEIPVDIYQERVGIFSFSGCGIGYDDSGLYHRFNLWRCLVEAYASENNARMMAIAVFHRQRRGNALRIYPSSITAPVRLLSLSEITEVIGGAKAQKRK